MEIIEIFKDSIKYPFSDIKIFLIIGVLFLAVEIFNSLGVFVDNSAAGTVGAIVGLVITVLIMGYELDVIKFGIELKDDLPSFDLGRNIKNGVKLLIVNIVYYIIPLIISIVALFAFGGIVGTKIANSGLAAGADPTEIMNTIFSPDVVGSIAIVAIIAIALFILFSLLALMGQARLAKTGNISEAISFGQSYRDLKEIGIGKTLAFFILLIILIIVIAFILLIFAMIPYIGIIIIPFIGETFLSLMEYRAYGLLYSEIA